VLQSTLDIETNRVSDFFALLKPRVMSLVVFTGLVGMFLAPGPVHPLIAFTGVLCIAVGAGAAGCINMWYERDVDALMARTCNRPLPAGRIDPGAALGYGISLATGSVVLMFLAANAAAATLLAITIGFYVFIYTMWLKRRTPQNIVIGGAAGAFPPMIGWAVVSGDVSVLPLILFAIIFMWTPPHFWALALYRAGDYAKAGIPMLPVVAGKRSTRRQIVLYTLLLVPLTLSPWALDLAGAVYGIGAAALGAVFLALAVRVWIAKDDGSARGLFAFSILYLFLLFSLLVADRLALGLAPGLVMA
jgi:protoheme IX farnesyltransferase